MGGKEELGGVEQGVGSGVACRMASEGALEMGRSTRRGAAAGGRGRGARSRARRASGAGHGHSHSNDCLNMSNICLKIAHTFIYKRFMRILLVGISADLPSCGLNDTCDTGGKGTPRVIPVP